MKCIKQIVILMLIIWLFLIGMSSCYNLIILHMQSNLNISVLFSCHAFIAFIGIIVIYILGNKLQKIYNILNEQAIIDMLTGLPNRRYFDNQIVKEFNRSKRDRTPFSIIMADIDYFKQYNDTYGHKAGDECLKKVAKAIEKSLRRPADFCARCGGEEFIVVLPATHKDGAIHVAESIRSNVQDLKIDHKSSKVNKVVTISAGVTTDKNSINSHENIVDKADIALYQAKAQGRNRVIVSE